MNLGLEPGGITPVVNLPRSKSYANRYLILAARHGAGAVVRCLPQSDDVALMLKAFQVIGLRLRIEDDSTFFSNAFPACESAGEEIINIDVGEGGTTARFLLALLSTGKRRYRLNLCGRLAERPWQELLDALALAGARLSRGEGWITVQGPVVLTQLPREVSAARSTQFATALQLAFAKDGIEMRPDGLTSSQPYWDLTQFCVESFRKGHVVSVPLDWSSAAYPICFSAVTSHPIFVPDLKPDAHQADAVLASYLEERGALSITAEGIRVKGLANRLPLNVDVRHCLDLVPALAFLAAHLDGPSVLNGVGGLVHKESDRLAAVTQLLSDCGVSCRHVRDALHIQGSLTHLNSCLLNLPADHRIVMTAALFLRAHSGGTLTHAQAVAKSYPDFFRLFL